MKENHQESNPPFFPLPTDGVRLSSAESSPKELRSPESPSTSHATETLSTSFPSLPFPSFGANQKIEIVFA